jgi:hypothetical protein
MCPARPEPPPERRAALHAHGELPFRDELGAHRQIESAGRVGTTEPPGRRVWQRYGPILPDAKDRGFFAKRGREIYLRQRGSGLKWIRPFSLPMITRQNNVETTCFGELYFLHI